MPTVSRATRSDLLTRVERRIKREVNAAAGDNALVSKREQRSLPDAFLSDVANDIRSAGGPGARVNKDELIANATAHVVAQLESVNQRGVAWVSASEVKTLLSAHPPIGARVAKAYELITGRRVTADEAPAPGVTGQLGHNNLTAARIALITEHAHRVAGSGDLMLGDVPPGHYIIIPVLEGAAGVPQGRSYSVLIPHDGFSDPASAERMWLQAGDRDGVVRTASFDVPVGP